MAEMDQEQLEARIEQAYNAYGAALSGRDTSGRPLPLYADLHESEKQAWRQAVMTALTPPPAAQAPTPAAPTAEAADEDEESGPAGRRRR